MKRAYMILAGLAVVAAVAFIMVRQRGGLNKLKRDAQQMAAKTAVRSALSSAEEYVSVEPTYEVEPPQEQSVKKRLQNVGVGLIEKHQDEIAKTGVKAAKTGFNWLVDKWSTRNRKDNPSKVAGRFTPHPPSYPPPPVAAPA